MSAGKIDTLMDILSMVYRRYPVWRLPVAVFFGEVFGTVPEDPPSWMLADYDVWYRNPLRILEQQIRNPEFANGIDYAAKVVTDENGRREVCDLMSGQWAWDQSELIAQDPDTHGATFAPIVLGSDKTTVSVGTGNTEYYPLYILWVTFTTTSVVLMVVRYPFWLSWPYPKLIQHTRMMPTSAISAASCSTHHSRQSSTR
ncbi:hypothetical protein HD554DRAFT_2167612 [Boletus coccyginus]|nr:hypothetical protein HD554DRAFT_2167612 [Boletus coccyginus]